MSYYELFGGQAERFESPVWTVPGNHEIFGIERDRSQVSAAHPLYGRKMCRHHRGPDYYSFNFGGVHFVGLNSVDNDDQWALRARGQPAARLARARPGVGASGDAGDDLQPHPLLLVLRRVGRLP